MVRIILCSVLFAVLLTAGCRTYEARSPGSLPVTLPEQYVSQQDTQGEPPAPGNWWARFNSRELDFLIAAALDKNLDIRILRAKVDQAKASLDKETAGFFPGLDFSAGGQKKGTQVKKTSSSSSSYDGSHSWDVSFGSTWTADMWGKISAGQQARILEMAAARKNLEAAALDLSAQIAKAWIDIIAARQKKHILDNQIDINNTLLELQKLRYMNGKADALDVSQQRETLAEVKSQYPLLEKQEKTLLNSLAYLSGKTSSTAVRVDADRFPDIPALPSAGVPAELLENRPDIKAARMLLSSSGWEIKAAQADLLPSLTLSAKALFSSGKLDLLFHNWVATLAASIAGPIFDGGLRKAEVRRLEAVAMERLNQYAKTVSEAIMEVEDQLVSIQSQGDYIRLLEEELELARLTLRDAEVQYRNGQSSYLAYLTAWTKIEQLERQLTGERATAYKERIGLYKALGFKAAENKK